MFKLQGKINELGMLEIPKVGCVELGMEVGKELSVSNVSNVIIVQKQENEGKGYVLDELHRVMLPSPVRKATGMEKGSIVNLFFGSDTIFVNKRVEYEKDEHDILSRKCEIELEDYYNGILDEETEGKKIWKGGFYSLMENMLIIVRCEKFYGDVIDRMLLEDNLLEDMADYYQWDGSDEIDLFSKKAFEFIESELMVS